MSPTHPATGGGDTIHNNRVNTRHNWTINTTQLLTVRVNTVNLTQNTRRTVKTINKEAVNTKKEYKQEGQHKLPKQE